MTKQHSDFSGCPIACALDIIGDRWTLLIVRDLMFFKKHEYRDFLAADEKISTNILSDRLKSLQQSGMIDVIPHPDSGTRKLYFLTEKGKDLVHTLTHLVRWSATNLKEQVEIPAERLKMLEQHPDHMIAVTLEELENWERQYGVL